MSLLTKDKITEIFCLADDFCKEYSAEIDTHEKLPDCIAKKMRNRKYEMSITPDFGTLVDSKGEFNNNDADGYWV